MKRLLITKDNLRLFIKNLKKDCDEFIAAKKEHLDDIIFGDTKDDGKELLDFEGNSVISPRAFLLPQTQELLEIKSAKKSKFIPIEDKKKRIFYGIRPCDIKALVLMQKFFIEDGPLDLPYKQKFDNSIFIVLACGKQCMAKSFCHKMDTGPLAKEGFDLQLIPLPNGEYHRGYSSGSRSNAQEVTTFGISRGYVVESGSKKGSQIVKRNKKLFAEASGQDEKEIKQMLKNFAQKIEKINFKKIANIMQTDKVKKEIWDDIGQRCVVCSGCITLCPTCSCFSIADRLSNDRGMRFRYCDGCPYAGFTRMAGANTPFPQHKDHIRRFFEHKLNIDVERYGTPSCVGCGRCIQTCPGNISIQRFIDEVLAS